MIHVLCNNRLSRCYKVNPQDQIKNVCLPSCLFSLPTCELPSCVSKQYCYLLHCLLLFSINFCLGTDVKSSGAQWLAVSISCQQEKHTDVNGCAHAQAGRMCGLHGVDLRPCRKNSQIKLIVWLSGLGVNGCEGLTVCSVVSLWDPEGCVIKNESVITEYLWSVQIMFNIRCTRRVTHTPARLWLVYVAYSV